MDMMELPDDCIISILGRTTPWDVTRLAGVCSSFKRAAESDVLWLNFLPSDYKSICGVVEKLAKSGTVKEVVKNLAAGVFLDDGLQKFVLLHRSKGVCRKLSVAAMDVAWGTDMRFWKWEHSRSSCFGKVAHLLAICWLEVCGTWSCSLPPGSYTAVWRLRVANPQGGRFYFLSWQKPLSFTITTSDNQELEKTLDLSQAPGKTFEDWVEFEVGTFTVSGEGYSVKQVDIAYGIRETDCTYWKGGLYLDCLTLRPAGCEEDVPPILKDREFTKIRGHPGVF
ncbi:hypothetical protein M758_12G133800 [Ceratodon purpureus]|uniref:F-box domain-containing protein n=1 Tax=Ceratodon purpureus TaxID=3225 RepID=A0A8T0G6N3_CERPU|nr:hypothetical protein KC19_12G130800 [Ceratodon purpureus]KAG0599179.1 hypothetical protein M758_12G133800 [Ceratodon purpureus]